MRCSLKPEIKSSATAACGNVQWGWEWKWKCQQITRTTRTLHSALPTTVQYASNAGSAEVSHAPNQSAVVSGLDMSRVGHIEGKQ